MFRSILAVLGGVAIGVFTISIIQYLSHQIYPTPADFNLEDTEAVAAYMNSAPTQALLLVLFSYALGSFFGGMVAARYAPARPVIHALIVGILLMAAGIANLVALPHPTWFLVASLLVYLPMAYFGGNMSARRIP
ncbi:hypothetical protein [Rufibacter radiotolerans]|uniref:hypothetical protein n=1 Tax=Rufibacter radiotolerans TaxID=1379910 RepID=UPI0006647DC9|nr:hypothetical protein [Rufibacter radiotolerans]